MTSRGLFAALAAAFAVSAAGCGHALDVGAVAPSPLERQWLRTWHVTPATVRPATGPRAAALRARLEAAARAPKTKLLSLHVYAVPELAPAITIASANPARYLHRSLERVVRRVYAYASYVRVVDRDGRSVFEWYVTGSGGALSVRPGLEGCSPVVAHGWPQTPPCPDAK